MYQAGDKVVYGIHGVCIVAEREERIVDRKKRSYLVLEPVNKDGSRFLVPEDNAVAMAKLRPLGTRQEIEALMDSPELREGQWIGDENRRKQLYRELISSSQRERLMKMVCLLYRHRRDQQAAGRKCHLCDENFLRDAEKLLIGELTVVLEMEPDQAKQYLRTKLQA